MSMKEIRKKIERHILTTIDIMDPTHRNTKRYYRMFEKMSDKDFSEYMSRLENGSQNIDILVPNMELALKQENIKKAADHIGCKIFERLWIYDESTGQRYLSPLEYPVWRVPVRRASQTLKHKMNTTSDDRRTSTLTGQVTGDDRGASVSLIEAQTMMSKGLDKSVRELISVRGGNLGALAEYKGRISESGSVNISELSGDTVPRSAAVAGIYLKAMHIDNNFIENGE